MSKVSEVKVPSKTRSLGTFKIGVFNLFDDAERTAYAELRTKDNDKSSGISIEQVREVTRVVTETTSGGEEQTSSRREDLYVIVSYWEKPIAETLGKVTDLTESKLPREWYLEREAKS
jgi:hypothetical protein